MQFDEFHSNEEKLSELCYRLTNTERLNWLNFSSAAEKFNHLLVGKPVKLLDMHHQGSPVRLSDLLSEPLKPFDALLSSGQNMGPSRRRYRSPSAVADATKLLGDSNSP